MRKNLMIFNVVICIACCSFGLSSCSSPGAKGKQFADKENQICDNGQADLDKLIRLFTVEFNSHKYVFRQDAKNVWVSQQKEIAKKVEDELTQIQSDMSKYVVDVDYRECQDFRDSYMHNHDAIKQEQLMKKLNDTDIPPEVLRAIAKIIPPKPEEKRMKEDLCGRTLIDVEGGYYHEAHRVIKIDDYDISDYKIIAVETESTTEYIVRVSMTLSGRMNEERQFNVQCKIRYVLPEYDDWKIDYIKTESLSPVGCDRYDECVKTFVGSGIAGSLRVRNICDKSLEVFIRYYAYGEWHKEVVVAKAQEDTFVSWSNPDESVIDYVMPL